MKIKHVIFLSLFILSAAVGIAHADMQSERQRIQDFKVWKLSNIMDLSSDQNDKFMSLFADLEGLNNSFIDSKQATIKRFDALLDEHNPDQGQVEHLLNNLDKEEQSYLRKKDELEKAMFKLLSPVQHAKYIKFQMEFPRMLRDIARERAMENRRTNFRR